MNALPGRLVLLGHPVSHSLSPVFQNAALAAAGISLRYEPLNVPADSLAAVLTDARAHRWAGNVTVPHKGAVYAACATLTPVAARARAVNAFQANPDGLHGHNTDVEGIRAAVRHLLGRDPTDSSIGVIGAGGAAAAVLTAVETWAGCKALVTNRSRSRLDKLVAEFRSIARASDVDEIAGQADIVINATSLGLQPNDPLPIDPRTVRNDAAVLDLVYSRGTTRLVREARARGLRSADGLRMLVAQGAAAFEWWFGLTPDRELMWQTALVASSDSPHR
jgi:shikimate dehydrogenase